MIGDPFSAVSFTIVGALSTASAGTLEFERTGHLDLDRSQFQESSCVLQPSRVLEILTALVS